MQVKTPLISAVRQFPLRERGCRKGKSRQFSTRRMDSLLKAELLKPHIVWKRLAKEGDESRRPMGVCVSLPGAKAVALRQEAMRASDQAARGCAPEGFMKKGKGMLRGKICCYAASSVQLNLR